MTNPNPPAPPPTPQAVPQPGQYFVPRSCASMIQGIIDTPEGRRVLVRLEHSAGMTLIALDAAHARSLASNLLAAADQAATSIQIARVVPPQIDPPNGQRRVP